MTMTFPDRLVLFSKSFGAFAYSNYATTIRIGTDLRRVVRRTSNYPEGSEGNLDESRYVSRLIAAPLCTCRESELAENVSNQVRGDRSDTTWFVESISRNEEDRYTSYVPFETVTTRIIAKLRR